MNNSYGNTRSEMRPADERHVGVPHSRHAGNPVLESADSASVPNAPAPREILAVLAEVCRLLDDYAPVWYSEQLHDKLARTLTLEHIAQSF